MIFTPQTFEIRLLNYEAGETETEERQGVVAEGTGLGYHCNELIGVYTVTHLASGYALPYHLYSEEHTRKWIKALAALLDWHTPAKELYNLLEPEKMKIRQSVWLITEDFISAREILSKERYKILFDKARELAQNL